MSLLIVYGTLKKGFGNNSFLESAKLLSKNTFEIPHHELKAHDDSPFPYLVETGETKPFVGEMYEVDAPIISCTDGLEGHPNFYKRTYIEKYDAFVYVIPKDSSLNERLLDLPTIEDF